MSSAATLLVLSSCAYAVIHALIPDHWLPFVLLSRSQGWTGRRLAFLAGLAGFLHAAVSTLLAIAAILFGSGSARDLAQASGHSLEFLSGGLLIVFGLGYGLFAHLREARAHRPEAGMEAQPGQAVHAHGHLLQGWLRGSLSGGALVAVVGISPCALLIPVLFTASTEGAATVLLAIAGFTLCTMATMVAVTSMASRALRVTRGTRRLDMPFLTRYGDLASGLLIAAMGLAVAVLAG